jgi:hypothetical protein
MLAGVALALGMLLAVAPAGAAQPGAAEPPKLDVREATAALADEQIYRAPGAVAYFDEERVRAALKPNVRILVAPYTGHFEKGNNYADGDAHFEQVYEPLEAWRTENKINLVLVEGLSVTLYADPGPAYGPSDIPTLRQTTAYLDVTEAVLVLTRMASGISQDESDDLERGKDYVVDEPVPPRREQLDEVADALRANRVYNAPGRDEDPIDPQLAALARKVGLPVRVAAFPVLEPGAPIVDYAPALRTVFPNDYILVAQGRWLDVTGPNDKIVSARDYAYGRYELGGFQQGSAMTDRMATVLTRLHDLLRHKGFGRPQPPPQPKPRPFDVARAVSNIAPWVLLGSAMVLGGAGLLGWRRRQAREAERDRRALHAASARAFAKLGDLGARILAAEQDRGAVDSAAAERHATATALFDQAHTAEAMAEVERIADEGLALEGAK